MKSKDKDSSDNGNLLPILNEVEDHRFITPFDGWEKAIEKEKQNKDKQ